MDLHEISATWASVMEWAASRRRVSAPGENSDEKLTARERGATALVGEVKPLLPIPAKMAYRRRQPPELATPGDEEFSDETSASSLATKAIRASSAHRDSSLSSVYGSLHSPSPSRTSRPTPSPPPSFKDSNTATSRNVKDSKQGFWGSLARKAKAFLDEDNESLDNASESPGRANQPLPQRPAANKSQQQNKNQVPENQRKVDSPSIHKGLGAISSSLNYIGSAVEEGINIVENRTAGIIQETRKHIRRKPSTSSVQNQTSEELQLQSYVQPQMQAVIEIQLKASRDVAMAMAAKAKLLLRELKTVKADLAFAKERCAQLEDENRKFHEHRERGENPEDDDLVRLQLETLLAEKARLAHENSIYARENRFLKEVVEYHQLTMQDVVYFDESSEEVTEVHPSKILLPNDPNSAGSTVSSPKPSSETSLELNPEIPLRPVPPPGLVDCSQGLPR